MENSFLQKTLQEIYSSKAFDGLDQFEQSATWSSMANEERELLALIFIMKGECLLKNNQEEAKRCFGLARLIATENPKVFCREALAYLSQSDNDDYLLSASSAAEEAILVNSQFFDGWFVLGNVLMTKGVHTQDVAFFYQADSKFEEASKLRHLQSKEDELFLWRWGLCWHFIAKQSGEAGDFHAAINKYQQAAAEGLTGTIFWNDYGNALVDLACLISRQELLQEAIDLYLKAVKQTPDFFEGWFNLACCYQHLCETWKQESSFQSSHMSFEKASALNSEDATLWYRWGQLLSNAGKNRRDVDMIHESFSKFEKADLLHPSHPLILKDWAEAEMHVGSQYGHLGLLHQAEKKILKSLELKPDNPHGWFIYGSCLNELGRYFIDEDYYCAAIEKFQYGISLNRNESLLWYGLALAHFALGDITQDTNFLEKAARYCSHAIEFSEEMFPQFWNDWGITLLKLGEFTHQKPYIEAALEKFEHAIKKHHEEQTLATIDPVWLFNYGCALDYMGDFTEDERFYEKAAQILAQVLVLDPNLKPARYNLALALSHLGEMTSDLESFHKACELFQTIVSQDSEDELVWNDWGVTLLHLAQLIQEPAYPELLQKCYQQAEYKLFQAALLGNIQAYYNLACLYSLIGNYETSLHYLIRAEQAEALPLLEDLLNDEWLDGVRETPAFQTFVNELTLKLSKDNRDL